MKIVETAKTGWTDGEYEIQDVMSLDEFLKNLMSGHWFVVGGVQHDTWNKYEEIVIRVRDED